MENTMGRNGVSSIADIYGMNVFGLKNMRNYLSEKAYRSLVSTIREAKSIDPGIADEVADAMKSWAAAKGATHFTHWFQPLTGTTAEKHDSFIDPDNEGGVMLKFSGKELIKGEPDASSFPSGGLRSTFEARGYTAWDPTSPAFIKEGKNGATLCIPTAFYSYHGDALDKKTPLLRSMAALAKQVARLAGLFGIPFEGKRAYPTLGAEQEYFLIDRAFYEGRLDLIQTGRTLFGRAPAKHQQLEDHYFGAIKPRIVDFMDELDRELWKLGIPSKTRHNEVCPAQFEIAPVYEELNLAVDHNMMTMQVLREVAERHGLVCLLHEKPYAGVNGSGKHNNWSLCGPDGKNWLTPGENPHENAIFLTIICALMKGIDTHAEMLRATVASIGNDHRLGANEAPPAIMSIFLGEQLNDVIEQLEKGAVKSSKKANAIEIGVDALPPLPMDVTDRNRTSPFAFTGNKFEFRAVGSSQNCAGCNVVINTIVAEALDGICTQLEGKVKSKKEFNKTLQTVLSNIVKKHKRIVFNGDNYTKGWHDEARKRGLSNLKDTPKSLVWLKDEKEIKMYEKYNVLSRTELISRYDIYSEQYDKAVKIEGGVALNMARTMIIPAAIQYQDELASTVEGVAALGCKNPRAKSLLNKVCVYTEDILEGIDNLEKALKSSSSSSVIKEMGSLRKTVDELEAVIPENIWPLPSYAEMLFLV